MNCQARTSSPPTISPQEASPFPEILLVYLFFLVVFLPAFFQNEESSPAFPIDQRSAEFASMSAETWRKAAKLSAGEGAALFVAVRRCFPIST